MYCYSQRCVLLLIPERLTVDHTTVRGGDLCSLSCRRILVPGGNGSAAPGHAAGPAARGAATALFVLLVAPLISLMAWSRFADTSAAYAIDVPPPDVIYSIIREPHHQSPFLSWAYFRDHWLPGYVMATPMLLACLWVAWWGETRQLRVTAMWLAGLLAYLFLVLGPNFFDRNDGVLGKFYLFRPSSLILLLCLMLAMAVAAGMLRRRAWLLRGPFWR